MAQTPPLEQGFAVLGPRRPRYPVILSVPHAGRDYPRELLERTRVGASRLKALEDRYVDKLVTPLAQRGFRVFIATRARAWIDLNRSEREIDPEMIHPRPALKAIDHSAKVRGGLGLVPRRLAREGNIYAAPLPAAELSARIGAVHRPYHAALSDALDQARRQFGTAVLLDCHSMPPLRRASGPAPDIVLGDSNGASAAPAFVTCAADTARAMAFHVAINDPYSGGHILARHGRPELGIHALQLELCRSLYLDFSLEEPGPRFAETAALVEALAEKLADEAQAGPDSLAAE
ncbi:N-formylglutamate amidohydrolase [uncultured Parasphingopyxis sp.]|uniref:N-formylglutamate amidohydrolase n=1 Tax=uncultured Parasphingopyxis sp. TaxID=1547918 RepID=UPI00262FA0B9|nr:N-formylglutamate amidohydrolase [uncultured Parasphingopyxis sp.]